jgi:hypothetical protein
MSTATQYPALRLDELPNPFAALSLPPKAESIFLAACFGHRLASAAEGISGL